MQAAQTSSFWLDTSLRTGKLEKPREDGIVVIGSGLSGVSTAYWLQEAGFDRVTLLDYQPHTAASFRNCGHILHGTVESMHALVALKGREVAREIWQFSIEICEQVRQTIETHQLNCDYRQDGYLVIAIDETEAEEVLSSVALLNEFGFKARVVDAAELTTMGFRKVFNGRFEPESAQAHPVKFRNQLLDLVLSRGAQYYSECQVLAVEDQGGRVVVETKPHGTLHYEAAVIASNAYAPLLSKFFASRQLVEPFRGQILCSAPLKHKFAVRYPHSFDHGYEYALVTEDHRLMIGGWRQNTKGGEVGTYDISPNPSVEQGLKDFVSEHYAINEDITWTHSWAGIMASSKTGFPFIGPTTSPLIFTVAGFTGHGFSWAHGSAKLLADIMSGTALPAVSRHFNPNA